jgi:UDP-N-acetyl-D-mannosaminuronate dehydrogenase
VFTDHDVFRDIDPTEIVMRNKKIIDTRNCIDVGKWECAGFDVKVLGKPS